MIERGRLFRKEINERIRIVLAAFKWAVSQELVSADSWNRLKNVESIGPEQFGAREGTGRRTSVEPWVIDATLPFLRRPVAAAVQFARITGARPSEILSLRQRDIDRSKDDVWLVALVERKNANRGKARVLVFDEPAQKALRPFLALPFDRHLFRPLGAVDELHERRWQLRLSVGGTPLYRSHVARYEREREQQPRQELAECYCAGSLRQANERAVDARNRPREREVLELLPQ